MLHTTADGLLTVNAPEGPGWQLDAVVGAVQGETRTTLLKCKRVAPGEFFFMLAKDYSVPTQEVVAPERLLRELYPRTYARMFQQVKVDVVRPLQVGGREWWEAGYQFLHPKLGALAKLERVTCVGEHVLLLSGEGVQADVRRHLGDLTAWMDGAAFASAPGLPG